MPHRLKKAAWLGWFCLSISLIATGCAQPPPTTPVAAIEVTAPPTTTPVPATATPLPSATETPVPVPTATATPEPTATPAPTLGPSIDNAFTAWCLPDGTALGAENNPANPPANARQAEYANGVLTVRNLPAAACVFIYSFNQPVPTGMKLSVFDNNKGQPWLVADLIPLEGAAQTVSAALYHGYIIAPPMWNISFEFVVTDAGGAELRRDKVDLNRWVPENCWNGRPPNVFTLRCPLPLDLHPWDAGYGTPMPTFPPDDED